MFKSYKCFIRFDMLFSNLLNATFVFNRTRLASYWQCSIVKVCHKYLYNFLCFLDNSQKARIYFLQQGFDMRIVSHQIFVWLRIFWSADLSDQAWPWWGAACLKEALTTFESNLQIESQTIVPLKKKISQSKKQKLNLTKMAFQLDWLFIP